MTHDGKELNSGPQSFRVAVDADGYWWRVFDDGTWSMCPTNPDNTPIPEPVTYYVPEGTE